MKAWMIIGTSMVSTIAIVGWLIMTPPEPTPLASFESPFVFGQFRLPLENPLTEEGVALGRRLFYDRRLSGNNEVACSTCHIQQLAFTDGEVTSVGVSGRALKFNSMSLVNLLWGPRRFFWNGRADSLEVQALQPIQHPDEMGQSLDELIEELKDDADYVRMFHISYGSITADNIANALASFLRTLVSANSKYDKYISGELKLSAQEELGRKLFMAHPDVKVSLRGGNCIDCHSQFLTSGFKTSYDGFSNNGLDADADLPPGLQLVTGESAHRGLFKVPTLRNIALTAPYMHDGRFATLEEVLDHYNEGIKLSSTLSPVIAEADNASQATPSGSDTSMISLHLSENEKTAIITFLHTLTDWDFVTNPALAEPFVEPVSEDS
jgi:cytochrome c peroxidase